jgi:trehalose 6-phosphate synthase/phosphatase
LNQVSIQITPFDLIAIIKASLQERNLLLALDYDGTLVEYAPRPELAQPTPELLRFLVPLASLPGLHVLVISGRPLKEIKTLLPIPGLNYVGSHGGEGCIAGHSWAFQKKRHLRPILKELQQDLAAHLAACQGWWIEEKPLGLVLHYRLATPQQEAMIRRSLESWRRNMTREQQFSILDGKKGIELLPLGVSKGAALGRVLAFEETLPFFPVCLGDDHSDESAFQAVQRHGGLGIKVGGDHESSSAIYGFSHPEEVQAFLRLLLSAMNPRWRL